MRDEDRARDWPHYKERQQEVVGQWIQKDTTYHSTTVLGKIYDLVKGECETKDFLGDLGLFLLFCSHDVDMSIALRNGCVFQKI